MLKKFKVQRLLGFANPIAISILVACNTLLGVAFAAESSEESKRSAKTSGAFNKQGFSSAGLQRIDAFFADEMAQLAVIRVYEVLGEIVKRLPADIRENNPQIDWRTLAGFRDFLSHNYDEIILAFIWQAIEDLPALRSALHDLSDQLSE